EGVRHPLPDRDRRLRARSGSHRPHRSDRANCPKHRGEDVSATDAPAAALELKPEQQAVLLDELEALLASVTDRAARALFIDLAAAVADGGVGEAEAPALEKLLEMGLQTGRVRKVHGPEAEQALLRLFHQTPR